MIQLLNTKNDNLIAAKISGKITKGDVEKIHLLIHNIIKKGQKVDFYFELEDFQGYELEGLWEDLKVDTTHLFDYGKIAFAGDKKWQEWAAKATDFFTGSEVKYFDLQDKEEAMDWIQNH